MDRELAELLTMAAARSFGELSAVLPILEEHLLADEYAHWQTVLERICDEIDHHVTTSIYDEHPELREQAESRLNKYGVLF